MKIKVSYSELVSGPGYNNRQAHAEIELSVENSTQLDEAYMKAWERVRHEVRRQLNEESEKPNLNCLLPF